MTRIIIVLSAFLVLASACGKTKPSATTPESSASSEPALSASPEAWKDDLSQSEKAAFMKAHVVPGLAPMFQAFDATEFANFGCATCHGPEGKAPQDFLPKLTVKDQQLTSMVDEPEMTKFMMEKVTPQMATILGKPVFNPETHEGFGCTGCHTVDML